MSNSSDEGKSRVESGAFNFEQYQAGAYQFIKPHESLDMEKVDWALGLGGETGEVIELVKHLVMHKEDIDITKLAKEIGDVLWYCAALCTAYNLDLGACAELNLAKLNHRYGGGNYTVRGSTERHATEEKFTDTPVYKEIMSRLHVG